MEGKLCEAPASHAQRLFQVPVGRYSTVLHGIDGILRASAASRAVIEREEVLH